MLEKIAKSITDYLQKVLDLSEDDYCIHKYGVEITIASIFNLICVMAISLLMGQVLAGVVFLITFIPFRSYCGGYHANTYLKCNLLFTTFYFTVLVLTMRLSHIIPAVSLYITFIFSFIIIYCLAPVQNKNKPLNEFEKKRCRKISFIFYAFLCVAAQFLYFVDVFYSCLLIMTILLVSILMVVGYVSERREACSELC